MKNLSIAVLLAASLTSPLAFANGGKIPDPSRSAFIIADNGGKIPDPTNDNGGKIPDPTNDNGGKIPDPTDRNGGKIPDPERQVTTMDSGYPTLSALLSKYFSI